MSRPYATVDEALQSLMRLPLSELESFAAETVAESIAVGLVRSAVTDGDLSTQKLLLERTEGRAGIQAKTGSDRGLVEEIRRLTTRE